MTTPAAQPKPTVPVLEMRRVGISALSDASKVVLEDVNWTVGRGDYWAVGGLLRSGKSDLLYVAGGLAQPTNGEFRWFGESAEALLEDERLAIRRKVGLVFDGGQLLHELTLAENVALPLRYHQEPEEAEPTGRIEALIALTGLEPWAGHRPADVSRNWQQRFGLARALALKPELLLLDDPLSGLDPRDAAWWIEKLEALAAGHPLLDGRPLTLVVTGNDLRPWRGSARQFALLQDRSFVPLGDRPSLDAQHQPVLNELLRPWNK
jgi:ABC-type transporter Mla maintaining outer membrane lipid asymmetry ATPase subunit MlaF